MVKISGLAFVKDAVRIDYPFLESIGSILPIVDEFVVAVGTSGDGTLEQIRSIASPKIRVIETQWNPNMNKGGYVLAQQTNIALFNCTGKWAFCLQADEVIHENDHALIMDYVDRYIDDDRVEGLAFRQINFWGDYRTVFNVFPERGRRRCRVVKPHLFVLSRGDAAGFTVHPKYKERGRKVRVIDTEARLFHYSHVKRSEQARQEMLRAIQSYWNEREIQSSRLDYYRVFPRQFITPYVGTHPKVMEGRIQNHPVSLDLSSPLWRTELTWTERGKWLKDKFVRVVTDRFFGRGSYKLIKE